MAVLGLDKFRLAECPPLQQVEHVGVDLGASGFEQVKSERRPASHVGVHETEARVQADYLPGENGLDLEQGIEGTACDL
jgi:hypothetical protein